jgi:hypothetical protein
LAWYCNLSDQRKNQHHASLEPIVLYNFHHFYGEFRHIITRELLDNIKTLFQTIGYDDQPYQLRKYISHPDPLKLCPKYKYCYNYTAVFKEHDMGDIFKLIGDLGFPIAVALAGGYFVYLTIKLLLGGVLGSVSRAWLVSSQH